jgi:hypothetical protein
MEPVNHLTIFQDSLYEYITEIIHELSEMRPEFDDECRTNFYKKLGQGEAVNEIIAKITAYKRANNLFY